MSMTILRAAAVLVILSGFVLTQDHNERNGTNRTLRKKLLANILRPQTKPKSVVPPIRNPRGPRLPQPTTSRPLPILPPQKPAIDLNPIQVDDEDKSCDTEDNQPGECVPYYMCNANSSIITNGLGLIDIRVKDGACASYLEVCCSPTDQVTTPIMDPSSDSLKPSGCGYRNPAGVQMRIVGNEDGEANFGEFNWMLAIMKEGIDGKLNTYQCGASLIHPTIALTAAHCVHSLIQDEQLPRLKVRAGEWDTQTREEIMPHQDRMVVKIIEHPNYVDGVLYYDAALLFLESPVEMSENVGTICLPEPNERIVPRIHCYTSGWGTNVAGKDGRNQVILKKVELPIIPNAECQRQLRATRLGSRFILNNTFICAGGELGKDACKGDGGSPLVCPIQHANERYVQMGTVSWGIGCGVEHVPGVYSNVPLFREWIDEMVVQEGHQIDSYQSRPVRNSPYPYSPIIFDD